MPGRAHDDSAPRADHHHAHGMPHRFDNAAAWAQQFDAPERDAWQQPDAVIRALGLHDDDVVADVGAGTGYFSVRLARAVPRGQVLALDVEPSMVSYVDARAAHEHLPNLRGRITPTDHAALDADTDLVLVVDTFHHLSDRVAYFSTLRQQLSATGRVAIVDFRPDSPRGPPKEHKLTAAAVQAELEQAGFVLVDAPAFLPDQYFLIFARAPAPPPPPR